jgi:hypothetical protein
MNKKTTKWFLVGFGLTLALLLSIVTAWPLAGSAQEGTNPNGAGGTHNEASNSPRTDDPLGRTAIPIAQDVPSGPNNRAPGGDVASTTQRTDDLLGRTGIVPPAGSEPGTSNRLASAEPAGPGHIVPPETEGQRHVDAVPGSPLMVPAADFRSDGFDPASIWFSFWGGYMRGGNLNTCMMAPAYLPNGATVYDIYASVVDNDAYANVWIDLFRVDNYDGTVVVMAQMWTDDAYAAPDIVSLEDYPIDYPLVEYPTYSYYLGACMSSSSIELFSVRLWYY